MENSAHSLSPHHVLHALEGNGFRCTEFVQPANYHIPKHFHCSPILLFVLSGSIAESICSREQEYVPSSVVIRPAGEPHTHRYGDQGARCLVVEIDEGLLRHSETGKLCDDYLHKRDASLFSFGLRLWREVQTQDSV